MDPIFAAAYERRSIRKYEAKQIPDDVLQHIIEVGRWAPSGSNVQLTRLLVVQDPVVLQELRDLVQSIFATMTFDPDTMFSTIAHSITKSQSGNYDFFYSAPTLVIACSKVNHPNALADIACVLDHMMLAAVTQGVGTCWINQLRWLNKHPAVLEKMRSLGMAEDETVFGALAMGYAAKSPEGVLPRTGNPVHFIR